MTLVRIPIACELFKQWQRARGGREDAAIRPFSRGWEDLLEDGGIVSAVERGDAERDVRTLQGEGWLELKSVRGRPHFIARVVIPLDQEGRWKAAFGFTPPSDEEGRRIREYSWQPPLAFLREARIGLPFEDLRRLDEFLANDGSACVQVPIKERSLQIFGDEKRLDMLADSVLFREGRLSLAQLGYEVVAEPLGWKRGPTAANTGPVIVLENAATWHSYDRWNQASPQFSGVIYGGGNRFVEAVGFLNEIFRELGGPRRVLYFGDLDSAGLRIPRRASERALRLSLPQIEPHVWSYQALLRFNAADAVVEEDDDVSDADLAWIGDLAESIRPLLASGRRLPQEHIGWEYLRRVSGLFPSNGPS
ncbi:hypothetical protein LBMAG56_49320 [Verrucomicrobiota bacterium]|nr:hypothetical protein LBMAG56_49320 [Verrucomicrobiota bacterium]